MTVQSQTTTASATQAALAENMGETVSSLPLTDCKIIASQGRCFTAEFKMGEDTVLMQRTNDPNVDASNYVAGYLNGGGSYGFIETVTVTRADGTLVPFSEPLAHKLTGQMDEHIRGARGQLEARIDEIIVGIASGDYSVIDQLQGWRWSAPPLGGEQRDSYSAEVDGLQVTFSRHIVDRQGWPTLTWGLEVRSVADLPGLGDARRGDILEDAFGHAKTAYINSVSWQTRVWDGLLDLAALHGDGVF